MVVFLDLEEDVPDDPHTDRIGPVAGQFSSAHLPFIKPFVTDEKRKGQDERNDPNLNVTTRALGCYPFVFPSLC